MGADNAEQLKKMREKYGLYCIAPKQLKAEGILLENMICYCNKGTSGEVRPPPPAPPMPHPPHCRTFFDCARLSMLTSTLFSVISR